MFYLELDKEKGYIMNIKFENIIGEDLLITKNKYSIYQVRENPTILLMKRKQL